MRLLLSPLLFFFSFFGFAQEKTNNQQELTNKIEVFILDQKLDSANYYLKLAKNDSYKLILQKITNRESATYKEYLDFISINGDKSYIKYQKISNFINSYVTEPKGAKINLDYVEIKWLQISELRNNGNLNEASSLQRELENYVNKFNSKDVNVLKVKTKIKTHLIVMYLIEKDIKNGKKLVLECLNTAKELNDKELQIMFLYYLSDFLVEEGKLQEYIDVSEESLELEKELSRKSPFYYSTIEHLIDAYVYKGGNNEKVTLLINEVYNNTSRRIHSYSLYMELLSRLEKTSPLMLAILKKFEVKNVPELVSKLDILTNDLNPNNKFRYIDGASRALFTHGYYDLAFKYKDKAIENTKKIYSQDLSQSLADYKTEQALKVKEKEITNEKEKTTLYSVIASLSFILLLITLVVLRKINKQSNELSEKNKIINKSLKEKELLVKEVHHRVKNNFQIVSSLLELQTKGIEDEKALELANEGKNRVKSMALIHQKLYQNDSGLIDFDEYIKLLTKELSSLYSSAHNVKTSISSENMMFDVDTAIPLGLIINEIITNSYKYAFRNDKENNLSISIHKEDNEDYRLIIKDNGPGLSDDFNVKKTKSLGLRLVNRLVKQLHGTLKQTNNGGAKFEIYFKDSNTRQLVN
ncbi:sensor histidine kinase [Polaribacter sp. MSW13]|uniref:histidine kinase n=1 Tax=Polaribacter marinus TaxID=2916838 RepID=A0A9X1VQT6_9FLAO|nr:sensor histidine kinase [Polaribacter marinus]MCI2229297.1 sensor histidine kinase [Polaribacter marinus]